MLKSYLITACRSLNRNRFYALANVAGLAVGMAGCLLIGVWVLEELRYDRYHEHGERIYRIYQRAEGGVRISTPAALGAALKRDMLAWHRQSAVSQLLAGIPGIGPVTASAIAATVPDASVFSSGRQFSAWLGLVPRQHSTGGKVKLGKISKRGDGYLRRLLVIASLDTLGLENSIARSRALGYLVGVAGKLLEIGEFEQRLTTLEAAMRGQKTLPESVFDIEPVDSGFTVEVEP